MRSEGPQRSLRRRLFGGVAWVVAMRWAIRGLGLVSTIILARLLTPADFGIIAMATMVTAMLSVFRDVGVDLALIRHADPQPRHYDTAWTYSIALSLGISIVLLVVAPFAADFFDDSRVTSVIRLMALATLIDGFTNIYTVDFRRNLDFGRDFRVNVIPKAFSALLTIALAFWWRNYWALVAGLLLHQAARVAVSFAMTQKRPWFSLAASSELWSFSGWVLLRSLANFLNNRLDQAVVGRVGTASALGAYYVAAELASVLVGDLIHPIGRALMPGYVRLREQRDALALAFEKVFGAVAGVAGLFGVGLALHAESVTLLLLGDQWGSAGKILVILALDGAVLSIGAVFGPLLTAIDRVRVVAVLRWMQLLLFALVLASIYKHATLLDIALAKLCVSIAVLPPLVLIASRELKRHVWRLPVQLLRPLTASAAMFGAVHWVGLSNMESGITGLLGSVIVATIAYVTTLFVLWVLTGRPDGLEAELHARLKALR